MNGPAAVEDPHIMHDIRAVLAHLQRELPQLMTSGENWQVTLHGGRSGDIIVEIQRKTTVVRRKRQDAHP